MNAADNRCPMGSGWVGQARLRMVKAELEQTELQQVRENRGEKISSLHGSTARADSAAAGGPRVGGRREKEDGDRERRERRRTERGGRGRRETDDEPAGSGGGARTERGRQERRSGERLKHAQVCRSPGLYQ